MVPLKYNSWTTGLYIHINIVELWKLHQEIMPAPFLQATQIIIRNMA